MFILPLGYSSLNWSCVSAIVERTGMIPPVASTDDLESLATMCRASGLRGRQCGTSWELDNFYMSFYIEIDDVLPILEISSPSLLRTQEGFILSGSISCWVQALTFGLVPSSTTETREVLGYILAYLNTAGFGSTLEHLSRGLHMDGTVLLT